MSASLISQAAEIAPRASHSLPMLLLRLRESVLLPLRLIFRRFDLTEQQARVLLVLDEVEALEMIALAEACCIHPPSLSRIAPKMCGRGWLACHKRDADRRRICVTLTPAGRELTGTLRAALHEAHAETKHQIGETLLTTLTAELMAAIHTQGDPAVADGEMMATGGRAPDDSVEAS